MRWLASRGRWWNLKVGLVCMCVSAMHATPTWDNYHQDNGVTVRKGLHPLTHLVDLSVGSRGHAAKIDFRFVVPLLLRPFHGSLLLASALFAICGVVTYALLAEELRRRNVAPIAILLSLSGVAATALGGVFLLAWTFYDAAAIALAVAAGCVRSRLAAVVLALVAIYTDERALLALVVSVLASLWLDRDRADAQPRGLTPRVLVVVIGIYVVSRGVLDATTDLRTERSDVGLRVLSDNIHIWPKALVGAFAFWWIVLAIGLVLAAQRQRVVGRLLVVAAASLVLASAAVYDITRSVSYLLPLVPVPVVAITRRWPGVASARIFGAAFVACALTPAFIAVGPVVMFKPLPINLLRAVGVFGS